MGTNEHKTIRPICSWVTGETDAFSCMFLRHLSVEFECKAAVSIKWQQHRLISWNVHQERSKWFLDLTSEFLRGVVEVTCIWLYHTAIIHKPAQTAIIMSESIRTYANEISFNHQKGLITFWITAFLMILRYYERVILN